MAKLASKAAKPRASRHGLRPGPGVVVIGHDEVLDFLWPMEVEALWGVGPASAARLHQLGVTTVGQLAALPGRRWPAPWGNPPVTCVHSLAWGRDARPVVPDRAVKSIGQEETYPVDLVDREESGAAAGDNGRLGGDQGPSPRLRGSHRHASSSVTATSPP